MMTDSAAQTAAPYRVLARKYRPQNFDALVGQDALVRTLKNAISSGRIAHAYILTGVRGVGKTTTARIIARALNYTGPDGKASPTTGPTDDCAVCRAIAEDRCPDVMEMDAASRTGVNDIRELIDGVRYAPTSARYKVYIVDEVHMLSTSAFNALLKTLEEPPPHVIFIFATTEIRKVPVTVLSRCQRFDLRRVDADVLAGYYRTICERESVEAEDEAIALISRAADGSVRDGLSILDQAIVQGGGKVDAGRVREMLGLSDRLRGLDLFEAAISGKPAEALEIVADFFRCGADAAVVIEDLLSLAHLATRLRAVPASGAFIRKSMGAEEFARIENLAQSLSMPALGRAWQILLKGLGEVNLAPNPQAAAEMVLIRLLYAADLPDPAELLRRLESAPPGAAAAPPPRTAPPPASPSYATQGAQALAAEPATSPAPSAAPESLEDVVALCRAAGEILLAGNVYQYARLVRLARGRLEIAVGEDAPPRLAPDLARLLSAATAERWVVSIAGGADAAGRTLAERAQEQENARMAALRAHPLVAEILNAFPGAVLEGVRQKEEES